MKPDGSYSLDDLLEWARSAVDNKGCGASPMSAAVGRTIGRGIIALLGAAEPCGWPKPRAEMADDNGPYVSLPGVLDLVPVDEMRGLAVAILRACDAADVLGKERTP